MKNKILVAFLGAVLVLAVGILSWESGRGKLQIGAVPLPSASGGGKGTVKGKVEFVRAQDEAPEPAVRALVGLFCDTDSFPRECEKFSDSNFIAVTNKDGKYVISNVPAQASPVYRVFGYFVKDKITYSGASSNFGLNANETKTINLVLTSTEKVSIEGEITDEITNKAISGATVRLTELFVTNPTEGL